MPLFDGLDFGDPQTMAALGALKDASAAAAQAAMPTRMRTPGGAVVGSVGAGALQGMMSGGAMANQYKKGVADVGYLGAETAGKNAETERNLFITNAMRWLNGQPALTREDLGGSPGGKPAVSQAARDKFSQQTQSQGAAASPTGGGASADGGGGSSPPLSSAVAAVPMIGDTAPAPAPSGGGGDSGGADAGGGSGASPSAGGAGNYGGMNRGQVGLMVQKLLGLDPTEAQKALSAAGVDPQSPQGKFLLGMAAADKSGVKTTLGGEREGVPLRQWNPGTGQYDIVAQNPKTPTGTVYEVGPDGKGYMRVVPGATGAIGATEGAKANAEQAARAAADIRVHSANAGTDYNIKFGGGPGGPTPTAGSTLGVASSPSSATPAGRSAPPPGALQQGGGGSGATGMVGGVVTDDPKTWPRTPQGTTVPAPSEQAPIDRSSISMEHSIPEWRKTEQDWAHLAGPAEIARMRLDAIADAMKNFTGGAFTGDIGKINAILKKFGMDQIGDADPAEIQKVLKNNAEVTLDTLKAATSRFTQMEFKALAGNKANPDMQPEAARAIIAEDLAKINYQVQMGQDWMSAKRMPAVGGQRWENPNDFEHAWTQANPISGFVERANEHVGLLKGEVPASAAPVQPAPMPHIQELLNDRANVEHSAKKSGKSLDAYVAEKIKQGYEIPWYKAK